jgi:excisionase family DNA binding protein
LTNYSNNGIDQQQLNSTLELKDIKYMKMLTANEAAKILKVSARRVRALIKADRLPAQKIGRDWVILEPDLELVRVRKPGRPKKQKGG